MERLSWIIYAFLINTIAFSGLLSLFYKNSNLNTFYTVLAAFDKRYRFLFAFNLINIVLSLFSSLIVFLYAFKVKSSLRFWSILFWARITFEVLGHFYDLQVIKSYYYQSPLMGLIGAAAILLPLLPSYIAHWLYIKGKN